MVPEQIQSQSMTADWEEKLLKIEHGEYDSDAFMGEISSMVSGLVKTYEAVKGADVLMQPEAQGHWLLFGLRQRCLRNGQGMVLQG